MALAEVLPEPNGATLVPETGGTLTVDLAAIEANWRTLSRQLRTAECAAVVKANAYGLGLEAVTAKLAAAGCKTFFVADIAEARRVRSRAHDAAIYVLNGFAPDAGSAFIDIGAQPVINSTTELAEWDAFVAERNWRGGAALHVDTGMNRLGIPAEEAIALAPRVQTENHGITLLMSHLACAEIADHPLNAAQIEMFKEIKLMFRGVPASLANSSGIFLGDTAHCDLARPGRGALRRQSDTRFAQPHAERCRACRTHPASPQTRTRRHRGLRRDVDRQAPVAPCSRRDRLCGWNPTRAHQTAWPASPARYVHWWGAFRWI